MESPKIWLEMTVAGFVYLAAAFFFVLTSIHVKDLTVFSQLSGSAPYVSVAIILLSYVTGISIHIMSQRLYSKYKPDTVSRAATIFSNTVPKSIMRLVETSYSTFILFRHLWIGTYFLGLALMCWSCQSTFVLFQQFWVGTYYLSLIFVSCSCQVPLTKYSIAGAFCCFALSAFFLSTYISLRKPQSELEDKLSELLRDSTDKNHPQAAAPNRTAKRRSHAG
ncbi:MAG: hypothetical protein ABSE63_12325 [Thermoguttaceae bacterium]|jgi:hypothetical protein